jgi:cytochrome P450 family 135
LEGPAAGLNNGSTGSSSEVSPHSGLPPGPRLPGAVQTMQWMYRPIEFMDRCRQRYGPIFSIRLGAARNIVVVGDPAHAMDVLSGDPEIYESGQANLLFRPVLGRNSLLVLDGGQHMEHRRIMLPNFKAGHVQTYSEAIERAVRRRMADWPMDEAFRLAPEMQAITYEAISRVVFGDKVDERGERLAMLAGDMMDRCASVFTMLPPLRVELGGMSPYARLMKVVDEIDRILFAIIKERREDPLSPLRDDVLSMLLRAELEDGSPLGDRAIRDEILTMIMAGFETTTAGLAWAFERILRTPRVLERLQEELQGEETEYLDAVIKETLRARPAVPIVARKVREPVELAGYEMPAGTVLMASVYLVHRDPEVYPDPDEFRPERFLDGRPDPRAWIPFGGGVRRCLGGSLAQLEMKIVLQTVFSELDMKPADTSPEPAVRRRFTFAPKFDCLAMASPRVRSATEFGREHARHSVTA